MSEAVKEEGHGRRATLPTVVLLGSLLAGACTSSAGSAPSASPQEQLVVGATVANPHSKGLRVKLLDGFHVYLRNGTHVTAKCDDGYPFNLRVVIESGQDSGQIAVQVPRADLDSTQPANGHDPFGKLDSCSES